MRSSLCRSWGVYSLLEVYKWFSDVLLGHLGWNGIRHRHKTLSTRELELKLRLRERKFQVYPYKEVQTGMKDRVGERYVGFDSFL